MIIKISSLRRELPLYLYFISLATVIDYFAIQNINFLFLAFAGLGLIVFLISNSEAIQRPGQGFLSFLFFFMALVSFVNYSTARWTALLYSGFFIFTFILYSSFFKQYLSINQIRKLLKIVFYLYFTGLIAGQLNVYFDLFAPLSGIFGFMRGSFGTILEKDGLRFFSLSSEPSYAAFMVIATFYTYLKMDPRKGTLYEGENLLMFLILLYMVLMFKSAYGVVLVGLMVLDFIGFSSTVLFMTLIIFGILTFLVANEYDIRVLNRVVNIIQKIDLSDPHSLYAIDFTAYYRVAPTLHYFRSADWTDFFFLLGHGPGASRLFVVPEIYGGYLGGEFLGGFMPAFFYDYGLIGGLLVMFFLLRQVPIFFSFPTAVFILMLLNANFNTQLFWYVVLCFHLLKYCPSTNPLVDKGDQPTLTQLKSEIG